LIKAFNPDKVYVQFPSAQLPYLEHVFKTMPNKQWYLNFHGHDILKHFEVDEQYSYTKLLNSPGLQRFQAFARNQSITLTACSQWLANRVEQVFNKKCNVIYNAIEFDFFSKKVERTIEYPYLFSYGRIEEDKGFIMLIDAYINVLSSGINLPKLLIGGDGSLMNELTKRIPIKFKQQIEFLGRLTIEEIRSYGQHADSIWIPSLRETFGLVVLESIAMNPTVYASQVGGIPEAGSVFIKFFSPTVENLKESFVSSINESNKRSDKSDKLIQFLNMFGIEQMSSKYLTIDDN
jgi:glycosyltransferase involved in cell wall biosynthesis